MNQNPYNKCLINIVCSVCTGKYLPSVFSHRPRSFIARSVRKPQANTFPYRTRTRLISLHYVLNVFITRSFTITPLLQARNKKLRKFLTSLRRKLFLINEMKLVFFFISLCLLVHVYVLTEMARDLVCGYLESSSSQNV